MRRSIRALGLLAGGLFGLLAVLVVVGTVAPRLLISDGLGDLRGETRRVGVEALEEAWLNCSEPIDRVMMRHLRVLHVEPVPGGCLMPGGGVGSEYRVLIQRYTFFGIPAGMISVCGHAGDCWARAAVFDAAVAGSGSPRGDVACLAADTS